MNLYSTKGVVKAIYLWLLKLNGIWYEELFICMMLKHLTPQDIMACALQVWQKKGIWDHILIQFPVTYNPMILPPSFGTRMARLG